MYSNYYDYRMQNEIQLVNDIQKTINTEFSAVACYKKLANLAPTKDERNKLLLSAYLYDCYWKN